MVEDASIIGFLQINLSLKEMVALSIFNTSSFQPPESVRAGAQNTLQHWTELIVRGGFRFTKFALRLLR